MYPVGGGSELGSVDGSAGSAVAVQKALMLVVTMGYIRHPYCNPYLALHMNNHSWNRHTVWVTSCHSQV